MKKLAKFLAVTLVCVLASAALVGCAPTPNTDYEQARANLIKNGYKIKDSEDEAFAEESVENILLNVEGVSEEDIEIMILAYNQDGEAIGIVWLKTDESAETYYEAVSKNAENVKEETQAEIKTSKQWLERLSDGVAKDAFKERLEVLEKIDSILHGKIGKVVYAGTPAAINATK